jgi:hypothetical protein
MKYILWLLFLLLTTLDIFTPVSAGVFKDPDNNQFLDPTKKWHTEEIEVQWTGEWQVDNIIVVVKSAINRVLGILGLIALIILLWWGFQMVTAAGDEKKYDAGFTYVKQAAWWLAMIGIAWFIVSIIFFVIKTATT